MVASAAAQTVAAPDPGPVPKYVAEPISLLSTALGTFHRPISSTNAEAQKFFDQGFQMMYAFARLDAVRSFREAWKRDPNCAICYWGEAWAWGSYLNGPMPAEQSPFAYYAIQKAISLKNVQASQVEKDFIDALAPRYVEKFDPKTRMVVPGVSPAEADQVRMFVWKASLENDGPLPGDRMAGR